MKFPSKIWHWLLIFFVCIVFIVCIAVGPWLSAEFRLVQSRKAMLVSLHDYAYLTDYDPKANFPAMQAKPSSIPYDRRLLGDVPMWEIKLHLGCPIEKTQVEEMFPEAVVTKEDDPLPTIDEIQSITARFNDEAGKGTDVIIPQSHWKQILDAFHPIQRDRNLGGDRKNKILGHVTFELNVGSRHAPNLWIYDQIGDPILLDLGDTPYRYLKCGSLEKLKQAVQDAQAIPK